MLNDDKKSREKLEASLVAINTILYELYRNKSSDEYKMKGDITKSPSYKNIEIMITDLNTLKRFPKNDASSLRQMFMTLHRPVFKSMAHEYAMEVNDRNTAFTAMYTIGYRILVGELSRIYASTEALKNGGIVYKPDKVSRKNDAASIIKLFNTDIEKKIDDYVKTLKISDEAAIKEYDLSGITMDEDYYDFTQEGSVDDFVEKLESIAPWTRLITAGLGALSGLLNTITGGIRRRNPIAELNYIFMDSYEKTIRKFDNVCALYHSTKSAYDEYMRLPDAKRNSSVEKKYATQLEKYNIQMKNLSAEIEHYNQRADKEADDVSKKVESKLPKKTPPSDSSTPAEPSKSDDTTSDNSDDDFQF